jgi:diguanylate cyclase (GGDEF)-like protein
MRSHPVAVIDQGGGSRQTRPAGTVEPPSVAVRGFAPGSRWPMVSAAACGAVIVAAFLAFLILGLGGHRAGVWVDDLTELVMSWVAALACAFAAAHHRGRGRIAWALLGASAFIWGVATVAWCWYDLYLDVPVPFPGITDVFFLASYPPAVAGVLTLPGIVRRGADRVASGLDGMLVAIGLVAISWVAVMHIVSMQGGEGILEQVVSFAYPALDVVIATMLYMLLLRAPGGSRVPIALLAIGLTCNAVADSTFTYLSATNSYSSANPLDVGWVAGYLLLALAALRAAQHPLQSSTAAHLPSRWRVLVPYVPVVLALGAAAREVVTTGALQATVFWMLGAGVIFFIARQWLTLADNHDLLDRISADDALMRYQASHDPLTGLANRKLFADRMDSALSPSSVGGVMALMVIDLDDFKDINDSLGHAAGDEVLVHVSERLGASIRPVDTAVRLGGDEFAVVIESCSSRVVAEQIGERVVATLNAPVEMSSGWLTVRASAGLAIAAAGTVAQPDLMRVADAAMYRAKAAGKRRLVIDSSQLDAEFGAHLVAAVVGGVTGATA